MYNIFSTNEAFVSIATMQHQNIFVCIFLVSTVYAGDILLGAHDRYSVRIYNEHKQANPALWKRTDSVTIETLSNHQVISRIDVIDLRPDRDGEAVITKGGIGDRSVTIDLKSPTILRGYDFQIEVYANNPNARYESKGSAGFYEQQYPAKI